MPTRCQIVISKTNGIKGKPVMIYKHHDGYPNSKYGVIANIMPFLEKFKAGRGLNDIESVTARLLQYLTNGSDKRAGMRGINYNCADYGVGTKLHSDIKYLYIVTPTIVYTYEVDYKSEKVIMRLIQKDYI